VLVELVDLLEVQARQRVDTPLAVAGLKETQVQAALRRLDAAGYLVGVNSSAPYPVVVVGVTEKALRAVGAWPTPEAFVDRLLASLSELAENAPTSEERSRARRVLDAVGSVGRDVLVNAAGSVLGSGVTGF